MFRNVIGRKHTILYSRLQSPVRFLDSLFEARDHKEMVGSCLLELFLGVLATIVASKERGMRVFEDLGRWRGRRTRTLVELPKLLRQILCLIILLEPRQQGGNQLIQRGVVEGDRRHVTGQRVGISELSKPSYEYQFLSTGYDLLLMHADTVVSFVDERGDYIMVIDARVQIPHGIIYEDKKEGLKFIRDLDYAETIQ